VTDHERLVASLTLEEKVRLLTGATFWSTHPLPSIGLREMVASDGPSGVRGQDLDERSPSVSLPSASCLGASWDVGLARQYGEVCAAEARHKGVHVVLGPTINLHRTPYGGRHFEAYSEDPVLTGELAAAYVAGVQAHGVGACPKHYVANDSETDRFTLDVIVDEQTLHEVYLKPFQRTVEAGAWMVMSAYNGVNGRTMTESPLLAEPLKGEWGFDGVVVSDWSAVRSVESAAAEQDLVFPGPESPWSTGLVEAVAAGAVDEAAIDRKVLRILRLAARVGCLEPPGGASLVAAARGTDVDARALARTAAIAGMVLLENDGILPLDPGCTIALTGHSAVSARIMGGGSAMVLPEYVVSPYDGLRAVWGDYVTVTLGAVVHEDVQPIPVERIVGGMVRCTFTDADGVVVHREERATTQPTWFGSETVLASSRLRVEADLLPGPEGTLPLAVHLIGAADVYFDDDLAWSGRLEGTGTDLGGLHKLPGTVDLSVPARPGVPVRIRVDYRLPKDRGLWNDQCWLVIGERAQGEPGELIKAAVTAAAAADVAVVVVGTNEVVESEGQDRSTLALPGHQDDLVEAVLAANPNTIVVVNSGSPVLMPWRDRVRAVLLTWFGGQEMGNALAQVLAGRAEPSGRLPTSWPATEADVPVADVTPADGRLPYVEGIHVGHRAWLRSGRKPAYPLGHGLGYTTWSNVAVDLVPGDEHIAAALKVRATNTGRRPGRQVLQAYAARTDTAYERPERWLVGFDVIEAGPGETVVATIEVRRGHLEVRSGGCWVLEPGEYTLHVGTSADELPWSGRLSLT